MPDRRRQKRPATRTRDVYTEADGLFGRITDIVIDNPARSGGIVLIVMVLGAIVSNAAFLQTARHPDPFFSTRPAAGTTRAPAAAATTQPPAKAPAPAVPPAQPGPLSELQPDAVAPTGVPLPRIRAAQPNPVTTSAPSRVAASKPADPKPIAGKPVASKPVASKPATAVAKPAPAVTVTADNALLVKTQKALAAIHFYDGPIDGMFGPQTKAAISTFEMRIGLIPTGRPSEHLLGEMQKGVAGAQSSADPISTGSIDGSAQRVRVKRVQTALNDIGYGPVPVDGRSDDKTSTAIRRFELDNGLPLSGQANDTVVAKLVKIGAMK